VATAVNCALSLFSGSDTFSVTLTDALGATVSGTVTVTVGPDPNSGVQGLNTPQLTILPGGHVGIAFQGIPGRQYQIQCSTNLSTWTTTATVTAASDGAHGCGPSGPEWVLQA